MPEWFIGLVLKTRDRESDPGVRIPHSLLMKTYRYGLFETILGDTFYVIERKTWFGWFRDSAFDDEETMLDVAKQLKEKGHIVYKA